VIVVPVVLGQDGVEVAAYLAEYRVQVVDVLAGQQTPPALGHKDQVSMQGGN